MSLVPITTRIDNTVGEQKIARILGRFAKPQEAFEGPVQDLIRESLEKQFRTKGRWGGRPWPRLSSATVRRKLLDGTYNKGALRRTDKLYNAATRRNDPNSRLITSPNGMRLDISVSYASAHQGGTKRMPAREIIPDPMPEEFLIKLRNLVRGYLISGRLG